jgi:hypothetical protein
MRLAEQLRPDAVVSRTGHKWVGGGGYLTFEGGKTMAGEGMCKVKYYYSLMELVFAVSSVLFVLNPCSPCGADHSGRAV